MTTKHQPGSHAFDDALYRRERLPQGEAVCPECGAPMHFHSHICAWQCISRECGGVQTTAALYDAGLIISMP